MSSLHMFLPAAEPARSETLARLLKTHHIPRHLVKGIALKSHRGELEPAAPADAPQGLQQEAQALAVQVIQAAPE
ncbi:hypothetical protein SAMN05216567_1385 [Variovorax sp. OK605]|uniref:hypothetical protein n=1 Tax=Variovorax sp. OK605 TaxID=1855317 RepID=UPI0008F12446|nr:hypothetical protein [Variovorax sp. OK605]SFQ75248.1 hypothetical protein SAMN05216567_1385 [Variovorax sp. OK605]